MVKKNFFLVFCAILLSFSVVLLTAGEFSASVSSTQIELTESFFLNLTLKDASPKEAPTISNLKKQFSIHSQQHSTNTTIVNGKVSSNITWKLSLTPKEEGIVQIPSLTVDTTEGLLATQPITLNIIKGSSSRSNKEGAGLNLITKVSNASPYKNEPFIYTAFLTSKLPLYNIQAQKMQVEDAIVELLEEPRLEEKVVEGVLLNVVEFNYLITPLKIGSLTIPSITIQGTTLKKRKDSFGSFFNDDFDPFAIMSDFERLKPFSLMAEEISLDVLPAISEVSPWLPAKSLILEEEWKNDQTLRVGEPFSRGFLIKAEGLKVSQLPHLEELNKNAMFKLYADKPEEQEKVVQGVIQSMRKEQYTLIPQQAGIWVLPEISISWWDSANKEKRTSLIPARVVEILPAQGTEAFGSQEKISNLTKKPEEMPVTPARPSFFLYSVIGILVFFLLIALLWGFTLQRRILSLSKGLSQKPIPQALYQKKPTLDQKEKREKLPDLNPT